MNPKLVGFGGASLFFALVFGAIGGCEYRRAERLHARLVEFETLGVRVPCTPSDDLVETKTVRKTRSGVTLGNGPSTWTLRCAWEVDGQKYQDFFTLNYDPMRAVERARDLQNHRASLGTGSLRITRRQPELSPEDAVFSVTYLPGRPTDAVMGSLRAHFEYTGAHELLLSLAFVLSLTGGLLVFLGRKKNYAEPGEDA